MLRKLFNLYPGEGKTATSFLILGFLWSLGAFGTLTLSEGMFLEHLGASKLPHSYLLTALCMCLLSTALLFSLHRLSIKHLLALILCASTACILTLHFLLLLTDHPPWLWYLFKIIGWMTPIAIYISFWAFIDQYYDLQDAKRCFCLFNAILYLGDAVAGCLISFTLKYLGIENLLLLFAASILSTLPVIYFISKKMPVIQEASPTHSFQKRTLLTTVIRLILKSPFTLILMLFYFLMQLIVITTEYSYMEAFERQFGDTSLTEFLGSLAMWVSFGNMLFGLFFYSRTVTRFGVNNLILLGPFFFLLLFSCWVKNEAFLFATLAFIAREGMIYTFDDNNLLLLISGVPTTIKNHVRIAIESFFEPIGMCSGAILLLLLPQQNKRLALALCLIIMVVVLFLRFHYPKAIFQNVKQHAIQFKKSVADWIASFSLKELNLCEKSALHHLQKGEEEIRLLALEFLLQMHTPHHLSFLLHQFETFSIKGQLKMIDLLSQSPYAKEPLIVEKMTLWRHDATLPSLRSAIHHYFAQHQLMKKEMVIHDLESEHLSLQAAAILFLKTSSVTLTQSLKALEKLNRLLQSSLSEEVATGLSILGQERRKENIRTLFPYLEHPSLLVARAAAAAIFLCSTPGFNAFTLDLIEVVKKRTDGEIRFHCLKALDLLCTEQEAIALIQASVTLRNAERKSVERIGLRAERTALLQLTQDEDSPISVRLLAGRIFGKVAPLEFKLHQKKLIRKEIERASFYLYQAEMIRNEEDDHDLAILKDALFTTFRSLLDFVIHLGSISQTGDESDILVCSLHHKNRKIRAAAIETLEKTLDPEIFSLITPLIDEKRRRLTKQSLPPVTLTELLETLQKSPSVANQIVALTLQARLQLPNWKEALKTKLTTGDEIFQHFAHELL